jgi:hypothetical protein
MAAAERHRVQSIKANWPGMRQTAGNHQKSAHNRRNDRTFQHQTQKATRHIKPPGIEGSLWLNHDARLRIVLSATLL